LGGFLIGISCYSDNTDLGVRILTPEEMQKVEYWARNTQIAKILTFFDAFPRFIHVPKPLLLGSNNESEILVVGDTTVSLIRGELANMD